MPHLRTPEHRLISPSATLDRVLNTSGDTTQSSPFALKHVPSISIASLTCQVDAPKAQSSPSLPWHHTPSTSGAGWQRRTLEHTFAPVLHTILTLSPTVPRHPPLNTHAHALALRAARNLTSAFAPCTRTRAAPSWHPPPPMPRHPVSRHPHSRHPHSRHPYIAAEPPQMRHSLLLHPPQPDICT